MLAFLRNLFRRRPEPPRLPTDTSPDGVYTALRTAALARTPADFGLPATGDTGQVYGLAMDMGYPEATATLYAGADGSASLYTSSGGGVIGGQAHERVRVAVADWLGVAQEARASLGSVVECPVPPDGYTTFYALTAGGTLAGAARTDELGRGGHALSPLFMAGHAVLAQLREVSGAGPSD